MIIERWYMAVALATLVSPAMAQEFGGAPQTFGKPVLSFGDDSDLGKYNYLGKVAPQGNYQIPGENSPITLDPELLQKLYNCQNTGCVTFRGPSGQVIVIDRGYKTTPEITTPEATASVAPSVASDEVRLDNPQAVELGLRLTVAGVPSVVNIKAADSFTRKLATGEVAIAEISSGSTVTTTQLNPGSSYAIQAINGAYFIVPVN